MLKKCIKCGEEKDVNSCFPKHQQKSSYYFGMCTICRDSERKVRNKLLQKERRAANPEKYRETATAYRNAHPEYREKARKNASESYYKNREKALQYFKDRYITKKDEISAYKKEYRNKNKESLKERKHEYYLSVKDTPEYIQKKQNYRIRNKENSKIYFREKYKTDIEHKIAVSIRNRINKAIKRNSKSEHTFDLIGCSKDRLVEHIRSKYKEGMTDEGLMNGSIHLDHIRPCASFMLSNKIEQYICANYNNIQPLWAEENISKNDKWDAQDQMYWKAHIWPAIKTNLIERGIIDSSYEGC